MAGNSNGPTFIGILLIIGFIALGVNAVGDLFGGGEDDSEPAVETRSEPTGAAKYVSSEQRKAYRLAYNVCLGQGPRLIGRQYSAGPNEIDIALAYSRTTFTDTAGAAATDGCLAGFEDY